MPITDQSERKFLGYGLLALGCSFGALAAALTLEAVDRMNASGDLCGFNPGHCMACISAAACLPAALIALRFAALLLQPDHRRIAAR